MATTTGVRGATWRAEVDGAGAVHSWNIPQAVRWYVAAEDRWHDPAVEPAVRQRRVDGTAVVETRLRVPGGDVVHTVYSVADHGGWTVIEVANESPSPIAAAFDSDLVVAARAPSSVPVAGLDLPVGSPLFPVGHRATLRVGISHLGRAPRLPAHLPPADAVVRGWLAAASRAGSFVVPDRRLSEAVVAQRCEVLLGSVADHLAGHRGDAAGLLIVAGQAVRAGDPAEPWVTAVAAAVERVARGASRRWEVAAAYDGAAEVLAAAGEQRALADLERVRRRHPVDVPPTVAPAGPGALAWLEQTAATSAGALLGGGWPEGWVGSDVEVRRVPVGPSRRLSYALRWHGDRPALIWELEGEPLTLSAPAVAPYWTGREPRGEVLWPAPVGAPG